jgi:hypothetical protein
VAATTSFVFVSAVHPDQDRLRVCSRSSCEPPSPRRAATDGIDLVHELMQGELRSPGRRVATSWRRRLRTFHEL